MICIRFGSDHSPSLDLPMKTTFLAAAVTFLLATSAFAGVTVGIADSATAITATGTLDGVGWTATTTASSPFVGINLPSGTWDLGTPLPANGLFLATGDVNAGDTQTFVFDQPVSDIYFYVENFDSSSAANIVTDGTLLLLAGTADILFTPTSASTGTVSTSNSSYDGVGDMILQLSGPTTFVQFDYTGGTGSNGIFYGFAVESNTTTTAVPEPSALLYLTLCGCGLATVRRWRTLGGSTELADAESA